MYHVDISERAFMDMSEIERYISEELYAPQAAFDLMDEFDRHILSLEQMPKRYALVRDDRLARLGIRLIPVKNYIVFYVVDDHAKTVTITRVLYSRRNWVDLL